MRTSKKKRDTIQRNMGIVCNQYQTRPDYVAFTILNKGLDWLSNAEENFIEEEFWNNSEIEFTDFKDYLSIEVRTIGAASEFMKMLMKYAKLEKCSWTELIVETFRMYLHIGGKA